VWSWLPSVAMTRVPLGLRVHLQFIDRFHQGIEVLCESGSRARHAMGHFLKWVGQDVKRECALELESNALAWGDVFWCSPEMRR
jgi:hypothetical protein